MTSPPDPTRPPVRRVPPILIGAGILVVTIGFGLPRLLPEPDPDQGRTSRSESPVAAAKPGHPGPVAPVDGPGLGVALARLAGSLVFVCGLCVLAARLVGKRAPAPTRNMEVLASLPVDLRCTVHLVRAGDRRLLLGIDPGGVKSLVELPGPASGQEQEVLNEPVSEPTPAVVSPGVVTGPVRVTVPSPTSDDIAALIARLRTTT